MNKVDKYLRRHSLTIGITCAESHEEEKNIAYLLNLPTTRESTSCLRNIPTATVLYFTLCIFMLPASTYNTYPCLKNIKKRKKNIFRFENNSLYIIFFKLLISVFF